MSTPPTAPPTDAERKVTELEYKGRRLVEELETLQKHQGYLQSEIARHDDALVTATDALAKLPKDAAPREIFDAKTTVIGIEFNIGQLTEQLAALQPELLATPGLIAATALSLAAAKKELP